MDGKALLIKCAFRKPTIDLSGHQIQVKALAGIFVSFGFRFVLCGAVWSG
jgi:hypothetical protein